MNGHEVDHTEPAGRLRRLRRCAQCGSTRLEADESGYYTCRSCGTQNRSSVQEETEFDALFVSQRRKRERAALTKEQKDRAAALVDRNRSALVHSSFQSVLWLQCLDLVERAGCAPQVTDVAGELLDALLASWRAQGWGAGGTEPLVTMGSASEGRVPGDPPPKRTKRATSGREPSEAHKFGTRHESERDPEEHLDDDDDDDNESMGAAETSGNASGQRGTGDGLEPEQDPRNESRKAAVDERLPRMSPAVIQRARVLSSQFSRPRSRAVGGNRLQQQGWVFGDLAGPGYVSVTLAAVLSLLACRWVGEAVTPTRFLAWAASGTVAFVAPLSHPRFPAALVRAGAGTLRGFRSPNLPSAVALWDSACVVAAQLELDPLRRFEAARLLAPCEPARLVVRHLDALDLPPALTEPALRLLRLAVADVREPALGGAEEHLYGDLEAEMCAMAAVCMAARLAYVMDGRKEDLVGCELLFRPCATDTPAEAGARSLLASLPPWSAWLSAHQGRGAVRAPGGDNFRPPRDARRHAVYLATLAFGRALPRSTTDLRTFPSGLEAVAAHLVKVASPGGADDDDDDDGVDDGDGDGDGACEEMGLARWVVSTTGARIPDRRLTARAAAACGDDWVLSRVLAALPAVLAAMPAAERGSASRVRRCLERRCGLEPGSLDAWAGPVGELASRWRSGEMKFKRSLPLYRRIPRCPPPGSDALPPAFVSLLGMCAREQGEPPDVLHARVARLEARLVRYAGKQHGGHKQEQAPPVEEE